MSHHPLKSGLALAALLALGACGSMNQAGYPTQTTTLPPTTQQGAYYYSSGTVQSIELVRPDNAGVGVGTIAGAVIGGVLGNQVGSGSGRTAATVIGAAGGAYAGNRIENSRQPDAYRIVVRMYDGSSQTVLQAAADDIRVGDRVQIDNGVARRY